MTATPSRILCATDFSPTGVRKQQLAVALARGFSAELQLLHVQTPIDDPHLAEKHHVEIERLTTTVDRDRRLALEAAASGPTNPTRRHVVRGLSAACGIVRTCAELSCDLIVLGTNGCRGLSHLLLGSVAESVLRGCPEPLLSVRT